MRVGTQLVVSALSIAGEQALAASTEIQQAIVRACRGGRIDEVAATATRLERISTMLRAVAAANRLGAVR